MADWSKILSRGNVDDRRGAGAAIGGLGLLGVVVTLVFNILTGTPIDLNGILNTVVNSGVGQSSLTNKDFDGADNYEVFVSTVLGSTNDYWKEVFLQNNRTYEEPKLVLFRTATQSGCGYATSDVGPHYCPADKTIYIDETFFDELQQKFKAKGGDVAEAYVIAHEVGHNVQRQLGTMDAVLQQNSSNQASIALELQADCYAGAWANSVSHLNIFENGEINEALDAAAAVGDDRIQQSVNGRVDPETWTHGSSADRVKWFTTGYQTGDPSQCSTF